MWLECIVWLLGVIVKRYSYKYPHNNNITFLYSTCISSFLAAACLFNNNKNIIQHALGMRSIYLLSLTFYLSVFFLVAWWCSMQVIIHVSDFKSVFKFCCYTC